MCVEIQVQMTAVKNYDQKNTATSGKLIKAVYALYVYVYSIPALPSATLPHCHFYSNLIFLGCPLFSFTAGTHCSNGFSGLSLTVPVFASIALSIL